MADLQLWLDGKEDDEGIECGWMSQVQFDFDRFQSDDIYAKIISDYVQNALDHLAREIEEIGVHRPQTSPYPPCEGVA